MKNVDDDEVEELVVDLNDDDDWLLPAITPVQQHKKFFRSVPRKEKLEEMEENMISDCSIVASVGCKNTLNSKILDLELALHNMGEQMSEIRTKNAEFEQMKIELEVLNNTKDLKIQRIIDDMAHKDHSLQEKSKLIETLYQRVNELTLANSELENKILMMEEEATEIAVHQITQSARTESHIPTYREAEYEVYTNLKTTDSVNKTGRVDIGNLEDMPNFNLQITQEIVNCKHAEVPGEVYTDMETSKQAKAKVKSLLMVSKSPPSWVKRLKIRNDRKARRCDLYLYGDDNGNSDDDFQPSDYPKPLTVVHPLADNIDISHHEESSPVVARQVTKNLSSKRFLSDENLKRLNEMERTMLKGEWVCSFPHNKHAFVELGDIYKILHEEELSNNVVNAHAEFLTQECCSQWGLKFKILDSTNWTYIRTADMSRDNNKRNRQLFVDEFILDRDKHNWDLLIFPINTNGNKGVTTKVKHWSLLVFDSIKPEWIFYNSIMGMNEYSDPYALDARRVKIYVEKKLKDSVTKWAEQFRSEDDSTAIEPLYEDIVDYPFKVYPNFPQQNRESAADSGFFMCYAMEAIAKREKIPNTFTPLQLLQYKASMVTRFIKD